MCRHGELGRGDSPRSGPVRAGHRAPRPRDTRTRAVWSLAARRSSAAVAQARSTASRAGMRGHPPTASPRAEAAADARQADGVQCRRLVGTMDDPPSSDPRPSDPHPPALSRKVMRDGLHHAGRGASAHGRNRPVRRERVRARQPRPRRPRGAPATAGESRLVAHDQRAAHHLDAPLQRAARHHADDAAHRLHDGAGDLEPAAPRLRGVGHGPRASRRPLAVDHRRQRSRRCCR